MKDSRFGYWAALTATLVTIGVLATVVATSGDGETVYVTEVVERVVEAPTTTSTSTTTTTSTTMAPKPAAPARSSLVSKVEEYAPGATGMFSSAEIEAGGEMACLMWNSRQGASRFSVIREVAKVMETDDLNVPAAISQAVLWTICKTTASFPNGPLPFDDWR